MRTFETKHRRLDHLWAWVMRRLGYQVSELKLIGAIRISDGEIAH
jgi:hypothetical protein